ncbi:MAG: hypothetical protein CMF74_17190 [Maricaulis sp.]|jgi:hypothetical protein|nr:hypothetical protein [Maricaulis sp.]HAQ34733.1 hypothetical protein [Alphaproteobacteria bacterium]
MVITPEIELAAVSGGIALLIGGAVVAFGHRAVLGAALRIAGFFARRRLFSTLTLGAITSGGLAVASATGLEPAAAGDAFSFFQDNLTEAIRAMGG